MCAATQKKVVHAYFFEFGKILEILQTHFSLFCFCFGKMTSSKYFFVSLEPNSYVFSVFRYFIVSLEKRNEFGVSLEILQTLPKLAPSSYFLYISSFFGGKEE